jgi:leucyl-tRNA synthetase
VSEDYEAMKFNTAIAAMMTYVNEVYSVGSISRGELKVLLLVLSPVAPHISEEIWQVQGFGEPIYKQKWPSYDEKYLVLPEVEIALQINGKLRSRLMVPSDLSRDDADKLVKENETIQGLIADKKLVKTIFVPGRLLNLVVKDV